jgi:alkylhydroperoxidase family enzyme
MPRIENAKWEGNADLAPLVERIVGGRGQIGELYPMLLNSPVIAEGILVFGTAVRQKASLSGQIRELVICRVGLILGAEYEVFRHHAIALREGVPQAKLDALGDWRKSASLYTEAEQACLAMADEMTETSDVTDETFAGIRKAFNNQEILEVIVTAAYYNMICRVLKSLRITTPPGAVA